MKFDLVGFMYAQSKFSDEVFGPGRRTKGVCNHIRKELTEIENDPLDLEEWADVVLLALDGAWRTGKPIEDFVATLNAKFEKNKARKWPDWRLCSEDTPIEHDRSGE